MSHRSHLLNFLLNEKVSSIKGYAFRPWCILISFVQWSKPSIEWGPDRSVCWCLCLLKSSSVPVAFGHSEYCQGSSGMARSYSPDLLKTDTRKFRFKLVVSCGQKSMNKEAEGLVRALPLPVTVPS